MKNMSFDEICKIRERLLGNGTLSADVFDALDELGFHDQCLDLEIKALLTSKYGCYDCW